MLKVDREIVKDISGMSDEEIDYHEKKIIKQLEKNEQGRLKKLIFTLVVFCGVGLVAWLMNQ